MTENEVEVELLPIAYDDLDEILDYLLLENPTAAADVLAKIMASFEKLKKFPNAGPKVNHPSIANYHFRMVIVEPYIAFYRFINKKVVIYRILHGARDIVHILENTENKS